MTMAPRWKAVALALLAATALIPEAALAEKMAKDMDLKDLPETFWYNEVTGKEGGAGGRIARAGRGDAAEAAHSRGKRLRRPHETRRVAVGQPDARV